MIRGRSNLVVLYETYSYRHAEEILNAHLSIKREITAVLDEVQEAPVSLGTEGLTNRLVSAFTARGWQKRSHGH
ncbi:MAG: hypothetical protein NZ739_09980 [Verrucomicrobiae bacterium]|nr:hypothetical protein [Verrucomicrobiae bacterium]MDW7979722.1 hypothetical protein [Verrucomicrobiales bacterium]